MITEFVLAWYANKETLEEYFRTTEQREYFQYEDIVRRLFVDVINPYLEENGETSFDTENLHIINDGEYQGCQLFIIPKDTHQPSPYQYVWTHESYGSCSGCDLLQEIQSDGEEYGGLPTENQVKQYMGLALNLLQRCRYMIDRETYWNEMFEQKEDEK